MKLPKHILEAPPTYLHENVIETFRRAGFCALPLWTHTGCALLVHLDKQSIKDCRYAVHSVELELHEVDGSPLIRIVATVYDRPSDPLRMDCFLNIARTDEGHDAAILALAEQEWFVFHWYDENLQYIRSSGVSWGPEQREAAKAIIEKAREIVDRTGGGDFDRAKAKFMSENSL